MKFKTLLIVGALVSLNVNAEEAKEDPVTEDGVVKITWQGADKFRDVKATSDIQSRYELRTFETLTKNLNKTATKSFQSNQKLEMVVTNVDLAGDVRPTFGATSNDIRVVKDIYPPSLTFSYKVLEDDKVIVAGDEKLRDIGFMQTVGVINDKPLRYETRMLDEWLKKSVIPKL
ncbi:DUF3016 domain-containing protein [Shewanella psychrotolerans]|uniref:DUF3016 domain-containing protein n=1 Tax=Shewanella psychrotolerans TaxID=2864206 RepID=UPI001C65878B|nr:DUF3016 domain-containing protein [Shewanella psychrotolerans]QYK01832.1 DUF3016 domain-containing protein [Shewanella psychrotolerans]